MQMCAVKSIFCIPLAQGSNGSSWTCHVKSIGKRCKTKAFPSHPVAIGTCNYTAIGRTHTFERGWKTRNHPTKNGWRSQHSTKKENTRVELVF
eukprot:705993-Amorphochlora_amoeboformis.AAC.1